ncbi:MAG: hypothetical protein ABSG94_12095 [Brevinematales bacterium]|jgi:hypothetical protein
MFEKKILFPVLRVLCSILAVCLLIGIIGGVIFFFTLDSREAQKSYISYETVKASLSSQSQTAVPAVEPKLNYSVAITKYLSGDNKQILDGWLAELKTPKEQQYFLNNLSDVINKAEQNKENSTNIVNLINQYHTLKASAASADTLGINQYLNPALKAAAGLSIFIIFMAFAMVVLVLLILAIERNTRKEKV